MWHDSEDRIQKAIERFEEADVGTAWRMLRNLEKRGVESPRLDLYLGHCHLELDRPEAAVRRYRRAARLGPRRGEPWVGLGLAFGRLGRVRKACSALRRAIRLAPELEEAHCQLVHCYVLLGEMDRALAAARRVEALDPTCPHVHRHLAIGHFIAGRYTESLASWRRVEARDPDHPDAATGIGRCLFRLRRSTEARASFQRALARDPRDVGASLGLGDLAADDRRFDDAVEHYRVAVELEPDDSETRCRLAQALLDIGQPAAALASLAHDSSVSSVPGAKVSRRAEDGVDSGDGVESTLAFEQSIATASIQARALKALGRRSTGLALLRATVAATPSSAEASCALGEYLLDEGHARAAVAPLRRAHRLDPSTPTAARLLARALGRAGRRKEAVAVVASASRRHPRDPEVHLDVAAALLARERPAAAERALLRGLSWHPDGADLWAALAEIALVAGRVPEARGRLRAALRRDRRHPRALSLLTTWLVGQEQWVRAAHAARAATRVVEGRDPAVRSLGLALLRLGRPREALAPLRRFVLAAPEDVLGYELLADALAATGDHDGALAQRRLAAAVERAA